MITTSLSQRLLQDSLIFSGTRLPAKEAVVVEGNSYTYQQLLDAASQLAGALQCHGLKRGDRVAVYMDNTWPCVVSIYATLIAGGVFLIINPQTKQDKLEYILEDSDAFFLLTDQHLANVFLPILEKLNKLEGIVCSGEISDIPKSKFKGKLVLSFDDVINSGSYQLTPCPMLSIDLAALIYTSGSTGNPKGVMHTHQSMIFAIGSLTEYLRLTEQHRILNVLPIAFDYGLYQLLMSIYLGATLILERSFTYPAQIFKRMDEYQVTVFPGVPTIYSMLLSAHNRKKLFFPAITRLTNTAAALPEDFIPKLREIFPEALIYKMYGLTECKRVSYLEPELIEKKLNSVGKAIPGTEVFLLSADGKPVQQGDVGILHVRGPHIMLGYWKQPERSAEMLKEGRLPGERILSTQDWFRLDEEGFLYFVGRSDDIIKTRGEKVSPIEVENVLYGIPGIKEAAVIGVPDQLLGEVIKAYVALDEGATLTEKDIKKICLSRLENFMVPAEVVILSELPKTTTNKISKKDLQKWGSGDE